MQVTVQDASDLMKAAQYRKVCFVFTFIALKFTKNSILGEYFDAF